ncbi:MAG: hypothetical protein ACLRLU_08915, partial [Haemophilus parainfluenzae]
PNFSRQIFSFPLCKYCHYPTGKTDKEGKVNFIPLIEGVWKLKVIHKEPFEDQKVCQHSANYATLILPVGKARAKLPPKPEHHH